MGLADAGDGPGGALGDTGQEVGQALDVAGHAAGHAQNKLDVAGLSKNALLEVELQVVQHAGVKNLNFRLDVQLLSQQAQPLQELGGVQEHVAVAPVHGAGVVGAHLRQQLGQVAQPLVLRPLAAGGGAVEDDVHVFLGAALPDQVDHFDEAGGLHAVDAVFIPYMEMGDGGAGLGHGHHVVGDLFGGDGHVRGLGLGGARAAKGGGDNDLVVQIFHRFLSSKCKNLLGFILSADF